MARKNKRRREPEIPFRSNTRLGYVNYDIPGWTAQMLPENSPPLNHDQFYDSGAAAPYFDSGSN